MVGHCLSGAVSAAGAFARLTWNIACRLAASGHRVWMHCERLWNRGCGNFGLTLKQEEMIQEHELCDQLVDRG